MFSTTVPVMVPVMVLVMWYIPSWTFAEEILIMTKESKMNLDHRASTWSGCLYFVHFTSMAFILAINWCLYRHPCILPERFGKIDLWISNLISVYRKRRAVVTSQTPVVSMTTSLIKMFTKLPKTDIKCHFDIHILGVSYWLFELFVDPPCFLDCGCFANALEKNILS